MVASIGGIPIYITIPWLFFAAFVVYATLPSLAERTAASPSSRRSGGPSRTRALFYGEHHPARAFARGDRPRLPTSRVHGITLVFWGGYTETHSSERGPLASFLISAAGSVQHAGPRRCLLARCRGNRRGALGDPRRTWRSSACSSPD